MFRFKLKTVIWWGGAASNFFGTQSKRVYFLIKNTNKKQRILKLPNCLFKQNYK